MIDHVLARQSFGDCGIGALGRLTLNEAIEPWDSAALRPAAAAEAPLSDDTSRLIAEMREEIRRVVLEELRQLFMG